MYSKLLYFLILVLYGSFTFGQGIMGRIVDNEGNSLTGVTILAGSAGTVSDIYGQFEINNLKPGIYNVTFSYVGYTTQNKEVEVTEMVDLGTITMDEGVVITEDIVVSASRRREKLTESPATISVIGSKEILQYAGNSGELMARQKGIDYFRVGAFVTGFNIRGFNSAFNPKMLQMDDSRISNLIATGLPFGPLSPLVKEDVERVEVVLGPSSALYGPNAHNGLIQTITKDPRAHQGTTVALTAGNFSALSVRLRHAQVINDKFAFKITGEYAKGKDVSWTDSVYISGKGYKELDPDYNFNALRGEASLYYSPTRNSDIKLAYGMSNTNMLSVTNAGRNQIKDWGIQYIHAKYTSPRFFAQVYHTLSSTDSTFAINQRTTNYYGFLAAGQTEQEAKVSSFGGARPPLFIDKSNRTNAEAQYNNEFGGFKVILGAQYQADNADSKGTYLQDKFGAVKINQLGFYTQIEKPLTKSLKAIVAARADNHDLYGFNFIPKAGLTYTKGNGTWRLTYGKGIVAPTILNLKANLFGGLILGNGEGFTLSDGSTVAPLDVETINTFEAGYKGAVSEKLFFDINAYYNISENFLSPLINIASPAGTTVTKIGDRPITDFAASGAFILTYKNFGSVNTYGADFGINYYFTNNWSTRINYSYFDYSLDENDDKNDGNKDGKVTVSDLSLNTPTHKMNVSLNYQSKTLYGSILARYTQNYDFFSGKNVAAATNTEIIIGGTPVVEGQRVGTGYNAGPLGGFFMDVNAGYNFSKSFAAGVYMSNIVGDGQYEFVASPPAQFLAGVELRYTFNAFAKR
ncbi:MAG: TonB-dependent receptor [Saprospiraceae bacterium]